MIIFLNYTIIKNKVFHFFQTKVSQFLFTQGFHFFKTKFLSFFISILSHVQMGFKGLLLQ